jgi:P27 family predicted phage terminase small subunit
VPGLEAPDLLKPEDRAMLTVFCETWSRFVAAVRQYRAEGMLVTNPDSENLCRHPAVGIAETAAAQLRSFAAEFGLTSSAEQRLAVVGAADRPPLWGCWRRPVNVVNSLPSADRFCESVVILGPWSYSLLS